MKIGLVCPYNFNKGGGVQECVQEIHDELVKRGHIVKIITPNPRKSSVKEQKTDSQKRLKPQRDVIYLGGAADMKSPFHTTVQVSVSVSKETVESLLADEKFDVLHFHEPWVPVLSRQILSKSSCANVATFHAKLPDTVMSKTIERVITPYTKSVLKYLHALTAVSESAAGYVRSLTDMPIEIIPNGINTERYIPLIKNSKRSNNKNQIVFIGRLERRKGVKFLILAFAQYAAVNNRARLVIAGAGPGRRKLELLADTLAPGKVKFTGYVNEMEKLHLLHNAGLFCSPALFGESFGIVLLEAMAAGLPVVAGDNPGYSGVLTGRGSISLVDPKNTDAFVRKLDLMMRDEPIRKLWREWAVNEVAKYAYKKVVDDYERLYEKVCYGREQ